MRDEFVELMNLKERERERECQRNGMNDDSAGLTFSKEEEEGWKQLLKVVIASRIHGD